MLNSENFILGIIVVAVSVIIYFLAWRKFSKHNYFVCLLLIVVAGFLLRSFVAADDYLHEWDERYHALVAKNLIDAPLKPMLYSEPLLDYDYRNWSENHIWLHKQPLALWTMAGSLKIFGLSVYAFRFPSILLSTLAILLTFLIAKHFFDHRIALLSAFLHSIHGYTIEITGGRTTTDHIDLFFMVLIELGIYCAIISSKHFSKKRYVVLTGVVMGLAILTKWLPALIIIGFWGILNLTKPNIEWPTLIRDGCILLFCCLVIALPWQLYIYQAFPLEAVYESNYNTRHLFEGLEGHDHPFLYHFNKIRITYGELIYIPLLWFVIIIFKRKRWKLLPLFAWLFVPLIFFSFAQTKLAAYTLFTAPVFFILTAYFWRFLYMKLLLDRKNPWLIKLMLFLLIALPIRYSFERIKPFSDKERHPQWVADIEKLEEGENIVYFGIDRPIEAMFYKDIIAYRSIPDNSILKSLNKRGYHIFIKRQGKIEKFSFSD